MGLSEMLVIAVIGLLVLGPERLPVAIRTVAQWVKSAKQMASSISSEMSHELKVHELHQNLKKAEQQGLEGLAPELSESVRELKEAAASVTRPYKVDEQIEQQVDEQTDQLTDETAPIVPSNIPNEKL